MNCPSFAYISYKCEIPENGLKQKLKLVLAFVAILGVIAVSQKLSEYVASTQMDNKEIVVVVDAGHGADDPGKIGVNNVLEKEINLQIAKKVQYHLEKAGLRVIMTREDDRGLYDDTVSNKKAADMKKRVALINEAKPNLVVSIHQNSYTDGAVKGAQVFYYTHSKEGEALALLMQEALRAFDSTNTRQAKANDTYYMLKKTEVPTIIVECGFLSNAQEAEKLAEDTYQEEVAEAICSGVTKWLDK